MAASPTETLSLLQLAAPCCAADRAVRLSGTTGLAPGLRLFVDRELMAVVSVGIDSWVNVRRGVDGTATGKHAPESYVLVGRADQFHDTDPFNAPPNEPLVQPWVNIVTGAVFIATGLELGANRQYWQPATLTHVVGALGVSSVVASPSLS